MHVSDCVAVTRPGSTMGQPEEAPNTGPHAIWADHSPNLAWVHPASCPYGSRVERAGRATGSIDPAGVGSGPPTRLGPGRCEFTGRVRAMFPRVVATPVSEGGLSDMSACCRSSCADPRSSISYLCLLLARSLERRLRRRERRLRKP